MPAAIRGMLEAAEGEEEISPGMARGFTHSAGVRYLDMIDMTLLVVLVALGLMAARYISKGASMEEMTMVAGVGMTLFMGLRFCLGC